MNRATVLLLAVLFGTAGQASAQSSVFVDLPRANSTVAPDFHIGGWAIDWAARHTTGVMTIHVWAYPSTGAPPIFLGVPSRGPRSDVARAFGQNFLNCGYGLNVRGLAPGDYLIAIFPFSEIRGGFDFGSAVGIPVTVRRPASSSRPTPARARAGARPGAGPTPRPRSRSFRVGLDATRAALEHPPWQRHGRPVQPRADRGRHRRCQS